MNKSDRFEKFGAVPSGAWPDQDLAGKAVLSPDALTASEAEDWIRTLADMKMTDPYVMKRRRK